MRSIGFFFSLSAFTLCFAAITLAQSSETGVPPFGSFHGSNFDMVSLKNGNLHVEIPIVSLPQRAAPNTGFRLVYDMPTWEVDKSHPTPTTTQWTVAPVSGEKVYWNIVFDPVGPVSTKHDTIQKTCIEHNPICSCDIPHQYQVHVNYVLTDGHGTKHPFNLRHVDEPPNGCADPETANTHTGVALDGSGYTADITSSRNVPHYQLADDHGQFNGNLGNELSTGGSTTVQTGANGVVLYRIDSVRDSDGNLHEFRIDYGPVTSLTNFCLLLPFQPLPSGTTCVEGGNPLNLPQKLTLPTGKFYQFTWSTDGNADLLRIDLPTGGSISYTYTTQLSLPPFQHGISQYKVRRRVTSRTVSDGTSPQTWTYSGGIVHDPLGNEEVHSFGGAAGGSDDTESAYEVQVDFYQGTVASGTLLRTIKKDYLAESDPGLPDSVPHGTINARLIRTTTILGDAAQTQTKTETDYETVAGNNGEVFSFLNPIEQREYAYGAGAPGAPLRRTDYTYLHTGNQNYLSRNIVHRVLTTTVYDGSNTQVAKTVNEYDNYSHSGQPMVASNAIQHDPAYDTSFIYRGNVTAVSHWRNTDDAMLTTTNQYDDAGNLLSTIDPLGHKTSFDYTDSWGNTSCVPSGQAKVFATTITNHLNQSVTKSYNSCTATLASVTDANLNPTTYSYDLMNRLASVTRPDGGSITNTYDDTQLLVTSSSLITSAGSPVFSRQHYDGLGRVLQSELCEDGTATCATSIKTDTTYDEIGQTSTVSNPYRTTTDPTYGVTTTHYDGLGRVTQINLQDGSISTTDYSKFPTITVADPAGNQRRSTTDALGRLIEVDEPGGGNPATPGTGSATAVGSEQSIGGPVATPGAGSATVSGTEQSIAGSAATAGAGSVSISGLERSIPCGRSRCFDVGGVQITVNGFSKTVNYGQGSTTGTIAAAFATAFNGDANSPVTASAANNVVTLTSKATGAASNYSLSATSWTNDPADFSAPSFTAVRSGPTLTGGQNAGPTTYDAGSVWVTVNGFQALANYGQGSTSSSVASAIANILNTNSSSPVTASVVGNVITLTARTTGASTNYSLSGGSTTSQPGFASPSFSVSVSGSVLTSGADGNPDSLATPAVTLYTYNTLGNLTCVVQKGGDTAPFSTCSAAPATWRPRTFTYNSLSQLLTASNPESGTISYVYDNAGNLLQKTSPAPNQNGSATQTNSFCYDELYRVKGKAYGAQSCPLTTPVVTYTYDSGTNGIGRLTGLTDQAGSGSYTYDVMGRVSTEQRIIAGVSKSMSYDYYLDGSVKAVHYPGTAVVTYTPDAAGRTLSAVDTANSINYVTGATYGTSGSITGFVNGSAAGFTGITNAFSYNKRLQPVNMSASSPTQTVFSLGYDFHVGNGVSGTDNGNVWGITNYKDSSRSQSFTYDQLNRVTSAQNAGSDCSQIVLGNKTKFWGNAYSYDAWGNLLSKTVTRCGAENLSVSADSHNQIHSTSGADHQFDAAGNMTFNATPPVATYTYDQENRITGAGGFTYTYDGDGNRVKKANTTDGTLYWYMSLGIVGESDLAGTMKSEYVFFGGERVARRDLVAPTGVYYYFSDHLKTTDIVTDAQGNIRNESDFYPWGGELQFLANDSNHYKFTGKERDDETQLDYFGARYYANGLGRFITPDWSAKPAPVPYAQFNDPQSLNQYTYVRNIPTLTGDPSGHDGFLDSLKKWFNELIAHGNESRADDYQSPSAPPPHTGPGPMRIDGPELLQQHMKAVATGVEVSSEVALLLDPTGTGGAIKSTLQGDGKGATLSLALGFIHIPGGGSIPLSEAKSLMSGWSKGSFKTVAAAIRYHNAEHSAEVGTRNVWQYMREAEAFKNELKGIKGTPVPGVTGGVKRYTKEGMYIDLDSKKRIVSFGSVNH